MSDVKAAAERLRRARVAWGAEYLDNPVMVEVPVAILRDHDIIADAYLAEHPADDGEAIDEAWLLSVGFENMVSGVKMRIKSAAWKDSDHHLRHTQFGFVGDAWFANGLGCAPCKTRGDVRRLAKALGIELKETK